MEEADKDWMMIRMVVGRMFLLVLAHPGSPRQRAVKQLLLLLLFPVPFNTFNNVGWDTGTSGHSKLALC